MTLVPLLLLANTTGIVEYSDSTSSTIALTRSTNSDRGGLSDGRFGPRRKDRLLTSTSDYSSQALGRHNVSTINS
jgi:hypothetical protein